MMVDKTISPPADTNSASDVLTPTFAFEHVAARLIPFDLMTIGARGITRPSPSSQSAVALQESCVQPSSIDVSSTGRHRDNKAKTGGSRGKDHALNPIFETNGLIFPYNPVITEGINVNYDSVEVTHSNESYFVYKNTSNVRINISNAVWTCDTFSNAVYALSALHFFRAYSLMDFGMPKGQAPGRCNAPKGRPPAPMWFEAYGNYAFHRVPVLLEKADWTFPNDVDYVGIPEFNTKQYLNQTLATQRTSEGQYTWLPIKFEISSISLIVQHSPTYWLNFSLEDYRSGKMLSNRGSFHSASRDLAGNR